MCVYYFYENTIYFHQTNRFETIRGDEFAKGAGSLTLLDDKCTM